MSHRKRVGLTVWVASVGILAGAGVWRSRQGPLQGMPPAEPTRTCPEAAASSPPASPVATPRLEAEEEYWAAVAFSLEDRPGERPRRDVVLSLTEDFLCLGADEARAFRSAALSAVEDVGRAWEVREAGWLAVSSSAASDPELLGRLEEEIQFRYESEKERALQRVAALLGEGERPGRLRERLEEWFDALR